MVLLKDVLPQAARSQCLCLQVEMQIFILSFFGRVKKQKET